MQDTKMPSRFQLYTFYRWVLPAIIIFCLFILSPKMGRPLALESRGFDFFARLGIALGYCSLYINLSDIDKYLFKRYRVIADEVHNNALLNYRNILLGILLGAVSVPFTWWIIQYFLPYWSTQSWMIATFHGLVLAYPIVVRRKMFMF